MYHGRGIINSLIDKLPIELHLPGYQYCGPGTRLEKRLQRGDRGINALDAACREHDIAYSQSKNVEERHKADKVLQERAWERVKSRDSKFGEKAAAWAVTTAMKAKRRSGMGIETALGSKVVAALKKIRRKANKKNSKRVTKRKRVLPTKQGGILPLVPIFAGLSALGSLAAGTSAAVKAFKSTKETQRHNKAMEEIARSKKGSGMYLRQYKKGLGRTGKQRRKCSKNS